MCINIIYITLRDLPPQRLGNQEERQSIVTAALVRV